MTGPFTRMEAEILSQRELLETGVDDLVDAARIALQGLVPPSRLVLTGCGDSICGAGSVAGTLAKWTGLPVEAVSPLAILRDATFLREGDLLIALSVSGRTARVVEAARSARAAGRAVLALTSKKDAPLSVEAGRFLLLPYSQGEEMLPGTLSFAAGLLAFLAVGEALSPDRVRSETLATVARRAAGRLPDIIVALRTFARATPPRAELHLLALDHLVPIAGYGRMKLLECCAHDAVVCDPEEWCHGPFFCAGKSTLVVSLIGPGGDALVFARAVAAAGKVGAECLGIVAREADGSAAGLDSHHVVVIDHEGPLAMLLFAVPLQLLAADLARRLGTVPFGFADEARRRANHGAIYDSTPAPPT